MMRIIFMSSKQPSSTAKMMMTTRFVSVSVYCTLPPGVTSEKVTVTGAEAVLGGASLSVARTKSVYSFLLMFIASPVMEISPDTGLIENNLK